MSIELIKWRDSFGCSPAWEPLKSLDDVEEVFCYSVGYVVDENDDYVLVVPHIHGEYHGIGAEFSGCGGMTIPKSSIVSRVNLLRSLGGIGIMD